MESSVNTDMLRSRVDTFVLKSLYEKDGYGYDILSYIYDKTQGHYEMKQSSIYSVLKRLEKQGFITSYLGEKSKGGQRRYYSLTEQGREFLDSEKKEWAYTRTLLDNLVTNTDFDLEKDIPPFKASNLKPLTRRTKSDTEVAPTEEVVETEVNIETVKVNEESLTNQPIILDKEENIIPNQSIILDKNQNSTTQKILLDTENTQFHAMTLNINDEQNEIMAAREEKRVELFPKRLPTEDKTRNIAAYRSLFGDIYVDKQTEQELVQKQVHKQEIDEDLNCHHINDLKNILKNEGYNLKPYKRDEMLGISKNVMIYSNKILRDCTLLSFLFFALSVLIVFRFRETFMYSQNALLVIGLSGLIIPVIGLIKYIIEPKRRIRAIFNFKLMLSYSVMLFLIIFVMNLIISLVTPSIGLTMKDAKLYPPIIFALTIPFAVCFYQLLYKSKLYHIKL